MYNVYLEDILYFNNPYTNRLHVYVLITKLTHASQCIKQNFYLFQKKHRLQRNSKSASASTRRPAAMWRACCERSPWTRVRKRRRFCPWARDPCQNARWITKTRSSIGMRWTRSLSCATSNRWAGRFSGRSRSGGGGRIISRKCRPSIPVSLVEINAWLADVASVVNCLLCLAALFIFCYNG